MLHMLPSCNLRPCLQVQWRMLPLLAGAREKKFTASPLGYWMGTALVGWRQTTIATALGWSIDKKNTPEGLQVNTDKYETISSFCHGVSFEILVTDTGICHSVLCGFCFEVCPWCRSCLSSFSGRKGSDEGLAEGEPFHPLPVGCQKVTGSNSVALQVLT